MSSIAQVFADDDPPVEVIVGSWPAARRVIGRFIPRGCKVWEGSTEAWFRQRPEVQPFFVIIGGHNFLLLYARSISGLLGLPIAIVRIDRLSAAASAALARAA